MQGCKTVLKKKGCGQVSIIDKIRPMGCLDLPGYTVITQSFLVGVPVTRDTVMLDTQDPNGLTTRPREPPPPPNLRPGSTMAETNPVQPPSQPAAKEAAAAENPMDTDPDDAASDRRSGEHATSPAAQDQDGKGSNERVSAGGAGLDRFSAAKPEDDPFYLQKLVKGKLIAQRLTQNKLSKALGIGVSSLSRWLNGLTAKMNQAYLVELNETMLAWVQNREKRKMNDKACWPGKGRKLCPSCKTVVRSNAVTCKKCQYSFLESEQKKKKQAAIEWPEHLRRPRNESSRRAAEARRRNRELGITPKSSQPRSLSGTRRSRQQKDDVSGITQAKKKLKQRRTKKSGTRASWNKRLGSTTSSISDRSIMNANLLGWGGEEDRVDWSQLEHQGAQTDALGVKFHQRTGGEGGGVGNGCGVLPFRALDAL